MEEIIESEAVVLLTSQECTYSTLHDHIPQCHESHAGSKLQNNTKILTKCLDKLSVKKEGKKYFNLSDSSRVKHNVAVTVKEIELKNTYCHHT